MGIIYKPQKINNLTPSFIPISSTIIPTTFPILFSFFINNNIWGSSRMVACTVAFVINYACYFSVIYRGGIEGVPLGQREAGQVLGMTKSQIFFKITLLQMVKRIVPPMSNEIITLVKDTALASVVVHVDLFTIAKQIVNKQVILWPLFYAGLFYLLFNGLLTVLFGKLEKKLDYFKV